MKKTLLLSLISCISFLGFTSANYTFVSDTNDNVLYSPNNITLSESFDFYNNVLNYNCENTSCQIIISDNDYNQMCDISYNSSDGIFTEGSVDNCNFSAGNYIVFGTMEDQIFSSITFGVEEEGGTEGGNNGGGLVDSTGPIISNGFAEFTPVIEGVFDITGELIPYVVYLGIGILVVILGFVAIKRLMNWMSSKVTSNFSSRRRK